MALYPPPLALCSFTRIGFGALLQAFSSERWAFFFKVMNDPSPLALCSFTGTGFGALPQAFSSERLAFLF
jgi:hypothetical protein